MKMNRRQFLGTASAAAFPFIFPGCTGLNVRKYAANEKVNVGVIGIGRISTTMDIPLAIKYTDLCRFTAVCDLDSTLRRCATSTPSASRTAWTSSRSSTRS